MATRAHCRARRAPARPGWRRPGGPGDTMALVIVDQAIYVDGAAAPLWRPQRRARRRCATAARRATSCGSG